MSLMTKRLTTNSVQVILHEIVGRVLAGFDRRISAHQKVFNKSAILKLVHISRRRMLPAKSLPNAGPTQVNNTVPLRIRLGATKAPWLLSVFRPRQIVANGWSTNSNNVKVKLYR